MKSHSFTKKAGRPVRQDPPPGLNNAVRAHQFRALGGEPYLDEKTGLVVAFGWVIDPETGGRKQVSLNEPELAAWPMGILYALGLASQGQVAAAGMHCWAHSVAFGRRSTVMRAMVETSLTDSLSEEEGDELGRLSELGQVALHDETCLASIHHAYMQANRMLLKRGAPIHGVINSAVIYEVRPSWWLDTDRPERTQGYRWTKVGLDELQRFWPDAINRIVSTFCP